jgi:hypothetical protein
MGSSSESSANEYGTLFALSVILKTPPIFLSLWKLPHSVVVPDRLLADVDEQPQQQADAQHVRQALSWGWR